MHIGIVGINHKSSSLPLRESLTHAFQKTFEKREGVLLSTCNRTEFYFHSRSLAAAQMEILALLREEMVESFEHALYSYFGYDCFNHLGKVVSGVDSALFGESDIQRQVKIAYEQTRKSRKLPYEIHYLFQKGLKIGKEMRHSFLIGEKRKELPYVIEEMIESDGRSIANSDILFIGNSAINRKLISFFQLKGARNLTLCTRMKEGTFPNVTLKSWDILKSWDLYDVVICGTYHQQSVLEPSRRFFQKTLLFDLSVPRNIDPILGKNPHLKLYNIDQIGSYAQKGHSEKAIALCEHVIAKVSKRQMELFMPKTLQNLNEGKTRTLSV